MLKRTKGRLLLTLLVITGLAGAVNNNSLSGKERKSAMNLMKDTKADALKSVKGLSNTQLNFKSSPDRWSVKECIYHTAISEKNLWAVVETTMKAPPNPEKRTEIEITDEQIIQIMKDCSLKIKITEAVEPKTIPYKTFDEAITSFKNRRAEHIKYMKSTTEDLRNHVVQMSFGWVDCYQLCLMMSCLTDRFTKQINELKADPKFPSR